MTTLEIGEHVDLDSGITIERTMEDEFKITDLENEQSILVYENELPEIVKLLGFVGRKHEDVDPW